MLSAWCRYKTNLQSLNLFVMVEATKDTVVYPYESEQFGAYNMVRVVERGLDM